MAEKPFQILLPAWDGQGGGSGMPQRFTPHPTLSPHGLRGCETASKGFGRRAAAPLTNRGWAQFVKFQKADENTGLSFTL
jgi:hypothetical protein